MAPASLPALAAMSPGPKMPSRSRQRSRSQRVTRGGRAPGPACGVCPRARCATSGAPPPDGGVLSVIAHTVKCWWLVEDLREALFPALRQEDFQHVVHGHDSHQFLVLVHDGQRNEIIGTHHLCDVA